MCVCAQAGGRLSLVELPVLLGVDGYHCDQAAAEVVAESAGLVTGTQGELITGAYFDGLAREVNDLLQESGQVGHCPRDGGLQGAQITSVHLFAVYWSCLDLVCRLHG